MSLERLNSDTRLKGDAREVGVAFTQADYELDFDIWSTSEGGRAAADLIEGSGRKIWGVVYEIPDYLIQRDTANARQRKSLDAIEGAGSNYQRVEIKLQWRDGRPVSDPVFTYIGLNRKNGIQKNLDCARHILKGLEDHDMPDDYVAYVKQRIVANNSSLSIAIESHVKRPLK